MVQSQNYHMENKTKIGVIVIWFLAKFLAFILKPSILASTSIKSKHWISKRLLYQAILREYKYTLEIIERTMGNSKETHFAIL